MLTFDETCRLGEAMPSRDNSVTGLRSVCWGDGVAESKSPWPRDFSKAFVSL